MEHFYHGIQPQVSILGLGPENVHEIHALEYIELESALLNFFHVYVYGMMTYLQDYLLSRMTVPASSRWWKEWHKTMHICSHPHDG